MVLDEIIDLCDDEPTYTKQPSRANGSSIGVKREKVNDGGGGKRPKTAVIVNDDDDCMVVDPVAAAPVAPAPVPAGGGGSAAGNNNGDDELQVLGATSTLPHMRANCPTHIFSLGSNTHMTKCDQCFCYVCDIPAKDCTSWASHCHATDKGPDKYTWMILRRQKKGGGGAAAQNPASDSEDGTMYDSDGNPMGSEDEDDDMMAQIMHAQGMGMGGMPYGMGHHPHGQYYYNGAYHNAPPPPVPIVRPEQAYYKGYPVSEMTREVFDTWHMVTFGAVGYGNEFNDFKQALLDKNNVWNRRAAATKARQTPARVQASIAAKAACLTCTCETCQSIAGFLGLPRSTELMIKFGTVLGEICFMGLNHTQLRHLRDSYNKGVEEARLFYEDSENSGGRFPKPQLVENINNRTAATAGNGPVYNCRIRYTANQRHPRTHANIFISQFPYTGTEPQVALLGTLDFPFNLVLRGEKKAVVSLALPHIKYFERYLTTQPSLLNVFAMGKCARVATNNSTCTFAEMGIDAPQYSMYMQVSQLKTHKNIRLIDPTVVLPEGGLVVGSPNKFVLRVPIALNISSLGTEPPKMLCAAQGTGIDFLPLVKALLPDLGDATDETVARRWLGTEGIDKRFESAMPAPAHAPAAAANTNGEASTREFGKHVTTDLSLRGLIASVTRSTLIQRLRPQTGRDGLQTIPGLLLEIENLGHPAVEEQPEELTVELYEHQKQGVQWMIEQERLPNGAREHFWAPYPLPQPVSATQRLWFSPILNTFTAQNPFHHSTGGGYKGGILADEMGLGKTAVTLALALLNPPAADENPSSWFGNAPVDPALHLCRGTLVVCPVSLVGQWTEEAKKLCGDTMKIAQYHGSSRIRDPAKLSQYDLVVTTYGILTADEAPRNAGKHQQPLKQMAFWRMVLDESHNCKSGNPAQMAAKIVSLRRWMVTGTPCTTKISDICGQLGLIGVGQCLKGALQEERYNGAPHLAPLQQALPVLRSLIMRHSQKQMLDGMHILGLPELTHEVVAVKFSPEERKAYSALEAVLQQRYRAVRHLLRTAKGSHSMKILTILAQFRQACSGGHLISASSAAEAADAAPLHNDAGGGAQAGEDGAVLKALDAFCGICNELLEIPTTTACNHVFCHQCIVAHIGKYDESKGNTKPKCPKCKKLICAEKLTIPNAADRAKLASMEEHGEGGSAEGVRSSGRAAAKTYTDGEDGGGKGDPDSDYENDDDDQEVVDGKAEAKQAKQEQVQAQAAAAMQGDSGVIMESKLTLLIERLTKIRQADPTAKTLVFSQFAGTLHYLKAALPKKGFQFRTLTGDMSRAQRTKALTAFQADPPTTIFLLSVRAGSCGINLTQANHVFLLEPCLNLALEAQAIGRVHRLGQTRKVTVTKFYCENSIESRILDMQKKALANEVRTVTAGAGSLSSDAAKELKITDYNTLFNVEEEPPRPKAARAPKPRRMSAAAYRRQMRNAGGEDECVIS